MKLNIWPFSFSVGIVTAVASIVCGLLIALAPEATMAAVSYLFHIDLTGLDRTITLGGFFSGLAVTVLVMMLGAASVAWLYDHLAQGPCGQLAGARKIFQAWLVFTKAVSRARIYQKRWGNADKQLGERP